MKYLASIFSQMKYLFIILICSVIFTSCSDDTYYNVGTYHAKQGDYEKAIEFFSKAIEQNPKDGEAYYSRAYCQQTLGGKEEQVISDYTNSLRYNPNDNEAYMNRGVAKMALGKNDEAIEDYKKSIEINPNYAIVYANIGNSYKLTFDNEKACINWNKSLELGNEKVRSKIDQYCK